MVLYGLTHQLDRTKNPFSGASGDDYEFYLASVDATNSVVLSGPVPNDSEQWSMDRMGSAIAEVTAMGLPVPVIFEFPRYAASVPAYRAAKKYFAARYDRGLYFAGTLRGGEPDYQHYVSQSFPYEVTDLSTDRASSPRTSAVIRPTRGSTSRRTSSPTYSTPRAATSSCATVSRAFITSGTAISRSCSSSSKACRAWVTRSSPRPRSRE